MLLNLDAVTLRAQTVNIIQIANGVTETCSWLRTGTKVVWQRCLKAMVDDKQSRMRKLLLTLEYRTQLCGLELFVMNPVVNWASNLRRFIFTPFDLDFIFIFFYVTSVSVSGRDFFLSAYL